MKTMLDAAGELERFLGDPCDAASAWSYRQALRSDEDESFPQQAVDLLDAWGLPEFYVPAQQHGGRFARMDETLHVLRAVARRDIAVAIAHAKTFLGSAAVWVGASPAIQRRCAALVRSRRAVSLGLTEPEHGGDLVANGCKLSPDAAEGYTLDGEKWLINNATRCAALTVHANRAGQQGAAAATLVWVEKEKLAPGSFELTPKIRTLGVRGADISGIRFRGAAVAAGDVIGRPGQGLEITLRSLQISRTLCCGLSTGAGDLAVRTLAIFMRERTLYRKRLVEHGFARERLARAFLAQLVAECVAFGAARTMHVVPRSMAVVSSVAKYLVPELVEGIYEQCEQGLGARAYLRVPPWSHFQKARLDHRLVGLFDGSTVVNLQAIAFQLPRTMERTLAAGDGADAALAAERVGQVFDAGAELPPLALGALSLLSSEADLGLRALCRGADPQEANLPAGLAAALERLREAAAALHTQVRNVLRTMPATAPEQFDAARRYAALHAAAACWHVWRCNRDSAEFAWDPAFAQGAWVAHAIDWLLAGDGAASLPDDLLPWLDRLVAGEQALSFLPLACPHAPKLDAARLATCEEEAA